MPSSNFGTGTIYYGKRDFQPDSSYVTTEFIVLLWAPLIPIRSLRVRRLDTDRLPGNTVTRYTVFSKTTPNERQVGSVYGFAALLLGFTIAYANGADLFPRIPLEIHVAVVFAGIALLSVLPALLRMRAKKKMKGARHEAGHEA